MKLLLHACCGPCSLEPVRLLVQAGHDITIAFSNSNIQPRAEYDRRLDTLLEWAGEQGIPVVDFPYDDKAWSRLPGEEHRSGALRENRCRACYRMRLEEAAAYASRHGFEGISTTLAVSPYQLSEVCHEELERAAEAHGLVCVWEDFRPYYPQATRRSREAGMYRQNYCGCLVSKAEADAERQERKRERAARAAEREAAEAPLREDRKRKREAYEARQRAKHDARKRFREQSRNSADQPYER
ncbi:epoxyqueuosine reductase QueH [Curtanaerobium respiraculi]|uniref:epoxyqueuosine reductase QueH n=1 Tax=Curtanaerobium respiraculi TaxID=2949669 RepID=UPI0024B39E86|nr:epoxyqueuosine reductase QueH [Curtanaerobium respiraculi]